jgi:hypothetical protein
MSSNKREAIEIINRYSNASPMLGGGTGSNAKPSTGGSGTPGTINSMGKKAGKFYINRAYAYGSSQKLGVKLQNQQTSKKAGDFANKGDDPGDSFGENEPSSNQKDRLTKSGSKKDFSALYNNLSSKLISELYNGRDGSI